MTMKNFVVLLLLLVTIYVQQLHAQGGNAFNPDLQTGPASVGELDPSVGELDPPTDDGVVDVVDDAGPTSPPVYIVDDIDTTSTDLNYTLTDTPDYSAMTDTSGDTLMSIINEYATEDADGLSYFRDALFASDMLEQILGMTDDTTMYTVFAPTNAAIKNNPYFVMYMKGLDELPFPRWIGNLVDVLKFHIVPNVTMTSNDIFDGQLASIDTMLTNSPVRVSQFSLKVGDAGLVDGKSNIKKLNGILHVVDHVLIPDFMKNTLANLELQPEYGPDKIELQRVSLVNVIDTVDKSRSVLNQLSDTGFTHVGCRIRAFNRLEEYLPQTLNDSYNVTWGELLNTSFSEQSKNNFLEYSLISKNYYYDKIPDNFIELVMPLSGSQCNAHMWITKFSGKLCFNNGCLIESDLDDRPGLRTFVASNGVGYVVDKCPICPGVAMLLDYATDYTARKYHIRQTSTFLVASMWNLRNLSLSVGDGTEVTLFASNDDGWKVFNLEDMTRLASDLWHPHKLDLLRHNLFQGRLTYNDLLQRYQTDGPYNLTSLADQPVLIGYNEENKTITIAGGDIFFKDVQGTDGLVHFTEAVPLPRSLTWTVYDYLKSDENFETQRTMVDAVYLADDMKQLSPLTVLYAPDESWTNLAVPMEEISKSVLENMVFKTLLWCDTLRALEGQYAESHNQKYWSITVNNKNMPCFEFSEEKSGSNSSSSSSTAVYQSCVTKCDILARNGIVHHIDTVLLFETAQTLSPKLSGARLPGTVGDEFDSILQNSTNLIPTTSDGSSSGDSVSASGGSDSFFQRPVAPTPNSTTATTSSTERRSISIWSTTSIVTIVSSMFIATVNLF